MMLRRWLIFAAAGAVAIVLAVLASRWIAGAGAPGWVGAAVAVLLVLEGLFWAGVIALGWSTAGRRALWERIKLRLFGRDEDQPD